MPGFLTRFFNVSVFFALIGCCLNIDCAVEPKQTLYFVFENSSGENLIEKGILTESDVVLVEMESGEELAPFRYENTFAFSFYSGELTYQLAAATNVFDLEVHVGSESNPDGCCAGYELKSISVDGAVVSAPGNKVTIII